MHNAGSLLETVCINSGDPLQFTHKSFCCWTWSQTVYEASVAAERDNWKHYCGWM